MFQKEDSKHFFQKLIHPGGCEKHDVFQAFSQ